MSELEQEARDSVKRIGAVKIVAWPRRLIKHFLEADRIKRYHFDFYGIGVGGYYIGFLNGHRNDNE